MTNCWPSWKTSDYADSGQNPSPSQTLTPLSSRHNRGVGMLTDIVDGALHAAFFIAPRRAAGTGGEVVVGRELEEAGGSRKIVIDFVTSVA